MNLPTLIILLILMAVVGAIIRKMIRDKKAGKGCSSCGGGCGGCHGATSCHSTSSRHYLLFEGCFFGISTSFLMEAEPGKGGLLPPQCV